ncbi:NUDIX domain-containing protein [Candidatus Parcubacteria bacterium]|nr:NUDIX domain-containing protein [Patescibacteria group bacterium]MBU4467081.1 NUDIX domain-containing protein [Patescibacteria group bacterium]MCG2688776.1 NUDIX domain-containing protein [Candidatus Parcubacteria bacterium]
MENKAENTKSAGGMVVNPNGKIALVLPIGRKKGWFFPKGTVKPKETILNAAVREIKEETGIDDLKLVKKLGQYQRHPIGQNGKDDKSKRKIITMFLFSSQKKHLIPRDKKEISVARWIKKEKVSQLLFHSKDKEFFLRISKEI